MEMVERLKKIVEEEKEYKTLRDKYRRFYNLDEFDMWHYRWLRERLGQLGNTEKLFKWIYQFVYLDERQDDGFVIPIGNEIMLEQLIEFEEKGYVDEIGIDEAIEKMDCDPTTGKKWVEE